MTVRVAVVGAGPALETGLHAVLNGEDWIAVETEDPLRADVVIYDVLAMRDDSSELDEILDRGVPILTLGRPMRPDLAARAIAHGAAGTLSTEAPLEDIVTALRDIAAGREPTVGIHDPHAGTGSLRGLTPRELTVLGGVARGLSNADIAAELFIGLNTVKSTIRSAYRKIDVTTRAQAVSWCLRHGFEPHDSDQARSSDSIS